MRTTIDRLPMFAKPAGEFDFTNAIWIRYIHTFLNDCVNILIYKKVETLVKKVVVEINLKFLRFNVNKSTECTEYSKRYKIGK